MEDLCIPIQSPWIFRYLSRILWEVQCDVINGKIPQQCVETFPIKFRVNCSDTCYWPPFQGTGQEKGKIPTVITVSDISSYIFPITINDQSKSQLHACVTRVYKNMGK